MNILVTGGAGYVGSCLVEDLINKDHYVKCLDRFFMGDEYMKMLAKKSKNLSLFKDDIRSFSEDILKDVDVVIDLAAISNDPAGEIDPIKTFEINHNGRVRVAKLSKKMKVKRYILPSSASVYGEQKQLADEKIAPNPLTAYSKANWQAEVDILKLNDNNFTTTILRFSSLYGKSPRMRFDLAVNNFVLDYFNNGKIIVHGKNNRRPFLHIKDAITAYNIFLEASKNKIGGEVFNVGSAEQNYNIGDLANEVAKSLDPNCEIDSGDSQDNRSYFASFEKIEKMFGFKAKFSVLDGSKQIFDALKNKELEFSERMITVKWYAKLLKNPEEFKELLINGVML